jgi:light-regulated signal transduction histidine kinase (bacteriophytochrome)
MKNLVDRALQQLSPALDGRQVEVTVGELPDCECDATLVEQVFVNLLSNAFKYSRQRDIARVDVGVLDSNDGEGPVYFVRDNGAGFDMEYAGKLFGVFQRLHRSEEYEGTGVGLAIVQRVVQRHGGRIWAEAKVGEGATFYFTLKGGQAWRTVTAA